MKQWVNAKEAAVVVGRPVSAIYALTKKQVRRTGERGSMLFHVDDLLAVAQDRGWTVRALKETPKEGEPLTAAKSLELADAARKEFGVQNAPNYTTDLMRWIRFGYDAKFINADQAVKLLWGEL
jgi:hypothetical protein